METGIQGSSSRATRGPRHAARGAALAAALLAALSAPAAFAGSVPPRSAEFGVSPARVRQALEDHALKALDGHKVSFDSLAGDVVVLHFWATWCRPCQRELPALDALNTELASKGGVVLAVAIDEHRENVRRFAADHDLKLPIVADGPAGLARELQLNALPCTVVFDRTGRIAFVTSGTGDEAMARLTGAARRAVEDRPPISTASAGETR